MGLSLYMVFDVESVGLHGEAFAVGYVVVREDDSEVDAAYYACPLMVAKGADKDRAWVQENIPTIESNCKTTAEVRAHFWSDWLTWHARGAILVCDCGWPVESRFLAACVDDRPDLRTWNGPYPLHEIGTALLMAGMDPVGTYGRLPSELPEHHPIADARQSARVLLSALRKLANQ